MSSEQADPKTAEPTPLALVADGIVKRLFQNGAGETTDRLVLTSDTGRDLGGLCCAAVKTQILAGLQAATAAGIIHRLTKPTAKTAEPGPELEFWAVVEVMGHARYAGRVSEYAALGLPLIRVEIPTTDDAKPAEILLGQSAIFRITPCTERAARVAARQFHVRPLAMVDLRMGTLETAPPRWLTQRDHEDDDDPDDHPDDHPMYD